MDGTPPPAMQRARGAARLRWGPRGLVALRQEGSAKAMLPRRTGRPEAVFLNTAGGLTGGDRFAFEAAVEGAALTVTTQTAERAYASAGGAAEVDVTLAAGPGADLAWLPQETILYDRSALHRRTRIDLAPGARLVACEAIVLGRRAMGETVRALDLIDRREVRVAGRPVWLDPLRLTPAALGPSPAILGGATAFAALVVVGQGAEDAAAALRAPAAGVELGASGWNGRAVLRMRAADPAPLRAALARAIRALVPLPRVWPH